MERTRENEKKDEEKIKSRDADELARPKESQDRQTADNTRPPSVADSLNDGSRGDFKANDPTTYSISSAAQVKNPSGCCHIHAAKFEKTEEQNEISATVAKIKSEAEEGEVNDSFEEDPLSSDTLGGSGKLTKEIKELLSRYRAGLRWGRKIANGEIRVLDDDEREEERRKDEAAGSGRSKRRKLEYPTCSECAIELHRPFICLECAFLGCFLADQSSGSGESHIIRHLRNSNHRFAFDIIRGTLFCASCDDVVYDPVFEKVLSMETGRIDPSKQRGKIFGPSADDSDVKKPPAADLITPPCRAPRGLRNMGATCFMNVIIQAFLHNPLLRNFFLSDRHNSTLCMGNKTCLACEMDKIFTEFFSSSPDKGPHGPTTFLYCMWTDQSSSELSQAGQHDAHEMFINALNAVHGALTSRSLERTLLPAFPYQQQNICSLLFDHFEGSGSGSGSSSEDEHPTPFGRSSSIASCPCVIHRTFSGQIQSDVTCQRCGKVTSTKDPVLDLSLDVRPESMRSDSRNGLDDGSNLKKNKNKKKDDKKDKLADREETEEEQHLTICLKRYCSTERLHADYTCSSCKEASKATKQLSLCRLPPVLCIQLKRFEHNSSATKIDTKVRFPLVLDVREFCTPLVRGESSKLKQDPEAYVYDLLTVVVHEGSMNTGHYTNFSRWRNEWYRFDDDKVAPASLSDVLGARAYQLCYLRRSLKNVGQTDSSSDCEIPMEL
ncbi:cysteine proteinase [Violaceomyces palustris]|uniref:Cysteine proteinase n=1 Tax=Violaceomyces palustris TaxID=1673888 RepID=A0ACD0NX22_9BASI|nr:cysteine proteinase [Violaceomyces palustris]